jgi:hypothetical protein
MWLNTRHVRARVPKDAAASVGGALGYAWHGRRGAGAASRRDVATQGGAGEFWFC